MQAEQYIRNEIKRFLKSKGIKDLSFSFDKPKQKQFGDLSSNIAMQMAAILKANPRQIATEIQSFISIDPQYIKNIDVAGPGFLNFFIAPTSYYHQLHDIIKNKMTYGRSDHGKGTKKDYSKAVKLLQSPAQDKIILAQYLM